jgi:hypothetical protein
VALGALVERRRRRVQPDWLDYCFTFVGLAGVITGIILLFNRLQ